MLPPQPAGFSFLFFSFLFFSFLFFSFLFFFNNVLIFKFDRFQMFLSIQITLLFCLCGSCCCFLFPLLPSLFDIIATFCIRYLYGCCYCIDCYRAHTSFFFVLQQYIAVSALNQRNKYCKRTLFECN